MKEPTFRGGPVTRPENKFCLASAAGALMQPMAVTSPQEESQSGAEASCSRDGLLADNSVRDNKVDPGGIPGRAICPCVSRRWRQGQSHNPVGLPTRLGSPFEVPKETFGDLVRGLQRNPSGHRTRCCEGSFGDLGFLNITVGGDVKRYLHKNAKKPAFL